MMRIFFFLSLSLSSLLWGFWTRIDVFPEGGYLTLSLYLLSHRILHIPLQSADRGHIEAIITSTYPMGSSRVADTLHTVYNRETSGRSLVILISDGIDYGSHVDREGLFNDACASASRTIFLHPPHWRIMKKEQNIFATLEKICAINGTPSLLFTPYRRRPPQMRSVKKRLIDEIVQSVADACNDLRAAYEIGFNPRSLKRGKLHDVVVKLKGPGRSRVVWKRPLFY